MDGYSVKDAAVVLGIPERRIWELLARGVLAGAPEGPDGMIVYLQPRGAPASVAAAPGAAGAASESTGGKANGNGESHELSPFRELLTEFRNLTERYGQALLALGEARGEVAALRNRVDLLEARVDLRLPSTQPTSNVAWEIPELTPEDGPPEAVFEADASAADQASATAFEEAVAGEDEPAAEPMIDLVEEAILAEELLAEEEPIPVEEPAAEPVVDETAGVAMAAEEPVAAGPTTDRVAPEADAPETEAPGTPVAAAAEPVAASEAEPGVQPEVETESELQAELAAAAIQPQPEVGPEEPRETSRRRARGGRTATAAFAAALARAEDPTIAELPGAEETAAALAALQRDIDASRASESLRGSEAVPFEADPTAPEPTAPEPTAPEPTASEVIADVEPVVFEDVAAAAETEAAAPGEYLAVEPSEDINAAALAEGPEPADDEPPAPDEASAQAETPGPSQASVPAYYSTDVMDPDWFADGDFSWLEAAQAEAIRIEAERSEASVAPPESATSAIEPPGDEEAPPPHHEPEEAAADELVDHDPAPDPMTEPASASDEPPGIRADEGGELRPVAIDVGDERLGVAAATAFGEHPDPDAAPPDVGHDQFEPSSESQAIAEEEARTAIQDAFEEAPSGLDAESLAAGGAALAVAVAEPETEGQPETDAAEDVEITAAAPEPEPELEVAADEPEAVVAEPELEVAADEPDASAGEQAELPVDEELVGEAEAGSAAVPQAAFAGESADAEPQAEAIQDAFEPPDQPAAENVHAGHEAEVEAEAIQDAFEEPTPAPDWPAPTPERQMPGSDQPQTSTNEPRAADDSPRTTAAAAVAFGRLEEFIAQPDLPEPPPPAAMPTDPVPMVESKPTPVSGEEALMWLGEEFEEADLEVAAQGWRSPDAAPSARVSSAPVLELSDAELGRLAEDEGWDADEVEAIRRLLGRPSDALAREPISPATPAPAAGPEASPSSAEHPRPSMDASAVGPAPATSAPDLSSTRGIPEPWSPQPAADAPGAGADQPPDPEWLQGRSGAAAEAYRRLRKLFPS